MDLSLLLLLIAGILFGIAAWLGKNLVAAGLALWVASLLVHRL